MPNKTSLLKVFKLSGQSDPKQAKIVQTDQQCGDTSGHRRSSIIYTVTGNYDPHGDREDENNKKADKHFESLRDCDVMKLVHLCIQRCRFVIFCFHAVRYYIKTGVAPCEFFFFCLFIQFLTGQWSEIRNKYTTPQPKSPEPPVLCIRGPPLYKLTTECNAVQCAVYCSVGQCSAVDYMQCSVV